MLAMHACNLSYWEVEAGGRRQEEFKANIGYRSKFEESLDCMKLSKEKDTRVSELEDLDWEKKERKKKERWMKRKKGRKEEKKVSPRFHT